jgi:deoxyribodipyrimidine photo-lyase
MVKTYEQILEQIDSVDPTLYAKTRNKHDGAVTKLSPYITRGVITLPEIKERLLAKHSKQDCSKLIQELAWREYFQNVWWAKGGEIFRDLRFSRDDWRHESLVSAIVNAETGIDALDTKITELYETGYMHNHVRMNVASVACNLAKAHWYEMGRWLYYHLIDGDPASNFLSWQWVAGTSVNKQYLTSQQVLNACSPQQQQGTWLDFEREAMMEQAMPEVLEASQPAELSCHYPNSEIETIATDKKTILYTPWTLNPTYQKEVAAERILLIDTDWFERLPVSERVMNFIVEQGKAVIPDLKVMVGKPTELLKGIEVETISYLTHQTNTDWPGEGDDAPMLVPAVTGYFTSFFKYWQKAQHKL